MNNVYFPSFPSLLPLTLDVNNPTFKKRAAKLKQICKDYFDRMYLCESQKYDMEYDCTRRQFEVRKTEFRLTNNSTTRQKPDFNAKKTCQRNSYTALQLLKLAFALMELFDLFGCKKHN